MKKRNRLRSALFLFIIIAGSTISVYASVQIDTLLKRLDKVMQQEAFYMQQKRDRINALNGILANDVSDNDLYYRYSLLSRLLNEYKSFKYDSSFLYAKRMISIAYEIKNPEVIADAKINMSFVQLSSGLFRESIDTLMSIQPENLPVTIQLKYYQTLNRAWIDLADYAEDNYYAAVYNNKGNEALKKAIAIADTGTPIFNMLSGLYYLRNHDYMRSRSYFEKLVGLESLPMSDQAIVTSSLAHVYSALGDDDRSIALLVHAAEIDIMLATKETVALTNLAEVLFRYGYTDFSLRCVNQALDDANFYGARHRKVQISNVLPIIESTLLKTKEKQGRIFKTYSMALTILALLLILFAYIMIRQNRKLVKTKKILDQTISDLKSANQQLTEANRIKEEYIGHFFDVISNYIEKIEKLKKSVSRKIMMNKIADIEATINNIDLIKEREELFASFDTIFMKLFPRFVANYNQHVGPEDQVAIEEGMSFSPELRIYALKRLGIQDNEKIARFLGYSVTTIYTYKTKLKKRSPHPDTNIEDSLMNIQME
ncbi:MAG: tetratricopeptide repeat protein [Bacteroidales bacterium]|nr:tetratricopeptide repeat protein [Bacteroidales bacterium]